MNYPSLKRNDEIGRRDALKTAVIVSGLFWLLLVVGANFDSEFSEKLRAVLGEEPNGLKFDLYILLTTLQLSIPMIFFLYHTLITLTYAKRYHASMAYDGNIGAVVGLIDFLRSLVEDTGEGPVIRRSKLIAFAGILYLLGIFAWWIYWTDKHGI